MLYLTTGVRDRAATVDISESLSQLDEWFNEGKPFFSRNSLRHIQDQLQRPLNKGDKIRILDLLDVPVFFEAKRGDYRAHLGIGNVVYTAWEHSLDTISS